MAQWIAWLRGINVGAAAKGRKGVPMAELRELADGLGWRDVQTYIQSGNLVFSARGRASALEAKLEAAIADHFGFEVPVVVIAAADLAKAVAACPFVAEAEQRANLVSIGFMKTVITTKKAQAQFVSDLEVYCKNGERVVMQGCFLWADYPNGIARSKLTPVVLDRTAGCRVTMRNVKTLRAVHALCS